MVGICLNRHDDDWVYIYSNVVLNFMKRRSMADGTEFYEYLPSK